MHAFQIQKHAYQRVHRPYSDKKLNEQHNQKMIGGLK